jgi:hypothetical protein
MPFATNNFFLCSSLLFLPRLRVPSLCSLLLNPFLTYLETTSDSWFDQVIFPKYRIHAAYSSGCTLSQVHLGGSGVAELRPPFFLLKEKMILSGQWTLRFCKIIKAEPFV